MYAIRNNSGQWWTGTTWGVQQARKTFSDLVDLPQNLDDGIDELTIEEFSRPENGSLDIRYFANDNDDACAGVVEL